MHDISTWALVTCVAVAFVAGFVDAVAGGGGLIQLPVLLALFPGWSLATVSGTNKSVSIVGTSGAAATYARRTPVLRPAVLLMAALAFAGSAAGAALVTRVDRALFEPVILGLLILVTLITLARPTLGTHPATRERGPWSAGLLGLVIGFYDGIMGPGTGMFLVVGLVAWIGHTFLTASATAKFVNVATNLAALVVFVPTHHVAWSLAATMAPSNLLGGWFGARTALRRGSAFVRIIFLLVMTLMIVRLVMSLK